VALLQGAGVQSLVDIRTAPGSRRHPHVARARMAEWLPAAGIYYRWEGRLGGFRRLPPDSPDVVWRNESFRAYAAHTRTEEFLEAVDELLTSAAESTTTVMCSEAVWWRCHRRIVADFVAVARGVEVQHLFHDGRLQTHPPTEGVRVGDGGLLVYDGGQERLGEPAADDR
ncbi:MAG: DUF488 family protein, partial [Nocardioidaceae bacterium]